MFRARAKAANYHKEMNRSHNKKRFVGKLLPRLPANSVIVMDNVPYHTVKLKKVPKMSTKSFIGV